MRRNCRDIVCVTKLALVICTQCVPGLKGVWSLLRMFGTNSVKC